MTIHEIEVRVDAAAAEVTGLLGHRRPGWLRPFLLLARRSIGDGAAGDVAYSLGEVVDAEDGGWAAALDWQPQAGADVFTDFTGRLLVRPYPDRVALVIEGEAEGGVQPVNDALLTRLVVLLTVALAESDLVVR
ncbi:MAG TPA: hypothetical protein VGN18_06270 [Jatrophihabitans sp.]|uniref:hypothetical protein n=1 Tax=Jatrophihabitans sp. TaxID=1932789 RepID=UPI002DFBEDFD|nr:hypothetical protein [Jatrophihabitans sp.]